MDTHTAGLYLDEGVLTCTESGRTWKVTDVTLTNESAEMPGPTLTITFPAPPPLKPRQPGPAQWKRETAARRF